MATKFCEFCGKEIDEESIFCPKCDRQLKIIDKNNKKEQDKKEKQSIDEKSRFYTQIWFMWLMLVVFAPIGIFLMWKFHDEIKKKTKIILSIVFGIFFLMILISNDGSNSKNTANNDSQQTTDSGSNISGNSEPNETQTIFDYTGKDAKNAYDELISQGYSIKFVFDRNNNGGFSDNDFQDYVINDSFNSGYYNEMPFTVTKQSNNSKNVTLYVEYTDVYAENNAQAAREQNLEAKLSIVSAMTACEQYGQRNYRNFKMHSIVGRIAERASDDNTWFLKYYVDYDGYKNKNMECYVSGTTNSPTVTKFLVY